MFVSDGSTYDVRHPEMILVTRTNIMFGIVRDNDRIPVEAAWCDPVHVTRVELINGQDEDK